MTGHFIAVVLKKSHTGPCSDGETVMNIIILTCKQYFSIQYIHFYINDSCIIDFYSFQLK